MEEALAQQEELDFATEILRVPTPEKPEPLVSIMYTSA